MLAVSQLSLGHCFLAAFMSAFYPPPVLFASGLRRFVLHPLGCKQHRGSNTETPPHPRSNRSRALPATAGCKSPQTRELLTWGACSLGHQPLPGSRCPFQCNSRAANSGRARARGRAGAPGLFTRQVGWLSIKEGESEGVNMQRKSGSFLFVYHEQKLVWLV